MLFEGILIATVILCIIVVLLVYSSYAPNLIKFVALPYTIILSAIVLWFIVSLAGAPIEAFPKGKWEYVAHKAEQGGKNILLWAWVEKVNDARLYRFPYDRKTMKMLDEADQEQKQGSKSIGEFKRKPDLENNAEFFLYMEKGHERKLNETK